MPRNTLLLIGLIVGLLYLQSLVQPGPTHGVPAAPAINQGVVLADSSADVRGRPSLFAAFMNRVLGAASSPAAGRGQVLYDLSLKYGIDDAFALAFFWHESNFGVNGEANITHSLGNLRCIPDAACVNTDGAPCQPQQSCYAAFPTWAAGFEAWYRL